MNSTTISAEDMVMTAIDKYADMVRRICFLHLGNRSDIEDVFQEVFLQYFLNADIFQSEQHEKAWICRVTFNKCKDMNKSFWRKRVVALDDNMELTYENEEQNEIITALLQLPSKYKDIVYLHCYEGWSIPEIAKIMNQNTNTIYSRLRRAKEKLKMNEGVIEWNG